MKLINNNSNTYKNHAMTKPCSGGTKQLEFNFNPIITSHNIYYDKLGSLPVSLHKLRKPVRTVRLNKVGSPNSINIPINHIKSIYKDDFGAGVFIELCNLLTPIPVRESINEINYLIDKERKNGR